MSFLEPLLAYIAKHLVATAAIGGLTVAGAAVTVDQVVVTPDEQAAALNEGTDPGEPAANDDAGTNALDDDEAATSRGRSGAVHPVIRGGDVEPGSRDFGRAVSEAASQGRSAQRGRSAEAPGKQAKPEAPESKDTADDGDAEEIEPAPDSAGTLTDTGDPQTMLTTPSARGSAKDRRPAPDDEAGASDQDATSGPGKSSARGRR